MATGIDLTGIDNVNEYYTNHYLTTIFGDNIKTHVGEWKDIAKDTEGSTPWSALRAIGRHYYRAHERFQRQRLDEDLLEQISQLAGEYLAALGYPVMEAELIPLDNDVLVPVALEIKDKNNRPLLWAILSASQDFSAGIMDSHGFSAEISESRFTSINNEELTNKIFFDQQEPPRWLLFIGMNQIILADRNKWNEKRCLSFDLETLYSRNDEGTWQAVSVLLHCDSLCPTEGQPLLDELDKESEKNAAGV